MKFTVELWDGKALACEVDGDVASIDGNVIPAETLGHLIQFGFRQCIRDAGAGAKTDAERNELALKKVDAIVNGTLRQGSGGGQRLDPVDREIRKIATAKVRESFRAKGWKMEADKIAAYVKALVERDAAKLRPLAEANLAAEADLELELPSID